MLDLVEEIHTLQRAGHSSTVDLANSGIARSLNRTELCQLLAHPGLSAIEIAQRENAIWFTDEGRR